MHLRSIALFAIVSFGAGTFEAGAQTSHRNLKNVQGIDPQLLIGTVCSGTYEVPGARTDRYHGAFKIEFFEADDFLRVSHSSKQGYVAYRELIDGKPVL